MRREITIKRKITLWFSVLLLIIVSVVMLLLLTVSRQVLHQDIKGKLKALVEANQEELEYLNPEDEQDWEEGDHFVRYQGGYLEIDDDFCDYQDGISIGLYQEEELIYGENPAGILAGDCGFLPHEVQTVEKDGEKYYVYDVHVNRADMEGLWIRGIVNQKAGITLLSRIVRLMLPVLPMLALVAIVGGYLIARRGLKPLDDICAQTDHVRSGTDLSMQISVADDCLEIRRLQGAFNHMLRRLDHSFEAEKQFASDASHELRTPVAVILAECEYALEEKRMEEYEEALTVIARQGHKMSVLIEEMLMFTRMERGSIQLHMQMLDLSGLAEEVCLEQKKTVGDNEKQIEVLKEIQPECMIYGDENLLIRACSNLVTNAYKYGREYGHIWVRVYQSDEETVFEVEDDGIGIDGEDLPKIWNRFYQVDSARGDHTSAGLGLALVKEIVELHGGHTQVQSVPGQGSLFRILFKTGCGKEET